MEQSIIEQGLNLILEELLLLEQVPNSVDRQIILFSFRNCYQFWTSLGEVGSHILDSNRIQGKVLLIEQKLSKLGSESLVKSRKEALKFCSKESTSK